MRQLKISTTAAIVYKNKTNRVNFDGYPEHMLSSLKGLNERDIQALVEG
jgi:hypothetical protein